MNPNVQKLRGQVNSQAKSIAGLTSENNKLKTENDFLIKANADLQKYNETNNMTTQNFSTSLNNYKIEIEKLQNEVFSLTSQVNEKTNKPLVNRLRKKVTELTNESQGKDEEISRLKLSGNAVTSELINEPSEPVFESDNNLNIVNSSEDTESLKLELNNVNGVLKETQQQLEVLLKDNMNLQGQLNKKSETLPLPPRAKLQQEINRLKNVINNKNYLLNTNTKTIQDLNKAVPKVIVKIDGVDPQELKNVPLRKRVFQLVNKAKSHINTNNNSNLNVNAGTKNNKNNKNKKQSLIHVHINDASIVKINNKELKNRLEKLITESEETLRKKNNSSVINLHLPDEDVIELDDNELKDRINSLIDDSELVLRNAKKKVNKLNFNSTPFRKLTLRNIQEDYEEENEDEDEDENEEEDDEEDNEEDIGQEDEEDDEEDIGQEDEEDNEEDIDQEEDNEEDIGLEDEEDDDGDDDEEDLEEDNNEDQ